VISVPLAQRAPEDQQDRVDNLVSRDPSADQDPLDRWDRQEMLVHGDHLDRWVGLVLLVLLGRPALLDPQDPVDHQARLATLGR
jgi:hypothetical protein